MKNERASTPAGNNNSSLNTKQNGLEQNNQTLTSCESEPITLGQILCLLADAEKTSERVNHFYLSLLILLSPPLPTITITNP